MQKTASVETARRNDVREDLHCKAQAENEKQVFDRPRSPAPGFMSLSNGNVIQAKLKIGSPNDRYEIEAEGVAERVLQMHETEEEIIPAAPRLRVAGDACNASPVSDSIERKIYGLKGKGRPLARSEREYYEPRFGRDFGHVRVHGGGTADELTESIGAKAFTVGNEVVLGSGVDRGVMAHELGHVVQQENFKTKIQCSFNACTGLIENPVGITIITGTEVHQVIQDHFIATTPGAIRNFSIPGASATPLRTQGLCGEETNFINPQPIGGMAGFGYPDLTQLTPGGILLIAEVKPAAIPCLIDGEEQLLRCIDQGNAMDPVQIAWRNALGIKVVAPMLMSHYIPPSFIMPGFVILTGWCNPGLMAYSVVPVPPPVTSPETETESEPVADNGFWDTMANLTGLTGAALVAYVIISEGSRIFIPRNAIPIP